MGLTVNSVGVKAASELSIKAKGKLRVFALAGNPNVGKSTLFNALTGMNQHTGNWAGKTVSTAVGSYSYNGAEYILADLPGTYSLSSHSKEEEAARNFLCFEKPCGAVVVCDASCLERNLNLVIQTMEIMPRVLVCVNLLDEAEKKNISVDLKKLEELLGVPVVGVTAREGKGLEEFKRRLEELSETEGRLPDFMYTGGVKAAAEALLPAIPEDCFLPKRWVALKLLEEDEGFICKLSRELGTDFQTDETGGYFSEALRLSKEAGLYKGQLSDGVVTCIYKKAEEIAAAVVEVRDEKFLERDGNLDRILTHRVLGAPLMALLLGVVLWLTIWGANYPSELLFKGLFYIGGVMEKGLRLISAPEWIVGLLIDGVFRVLAWVTSVMLPPMAIFFPLFTLLEDSGYLPRVAFNLDRHFQRACACGKQSLTMCMVYIILY